jgi:two-component system, NtrC family, sensor kinase
MRVLLADDDRIFQIMLGRALKQWGYEPVIVSDGEEALRLLSEPNGPRLGILDWEMPKVDGLEVCREARSHNSQQYCYLILLTSKTDSSNLVAGLEAGADDYLAKPVNLTELRLRLQAGRRLLELEERHRIVAEAASDGIVTMEAGDRIQMVNNAAGFILGYPSQTLVGETLSRFIPGFDAFVASKLAGGPTGGAAGEHRSWAPAEMSGRHSNGKELMLEVSLCESVGSFSKRALTAIIRDVTERRLEERSRAQAQKMESIGQLAAGIAHEINTPIQYIGDNGRFLLDAFRDLLKVIEVRGESSAGTCEEVDMEYLSAEIPKAIDQLLEGVSHVARIVRAMKEFSHPGPAEKCPVNLNRAIESTIIVSRNEWKYVADLVTDFDPDLPTVPCLAGRFNQVILNLIVNASHAISDVVDGSGRRGTITIGTRRSGDWAEVWVCDTGKGIPESIRSRVFDPFFTTKDVGKGTGQGLALAHAVIVQEHMGTIGFDSEVGAGTRFTIQLPLEQSLVN